jgi:16S rRNA C1402 (ribose-2'-O) methylase RsmI
VIDSLQSIKGEFTIVLSPQDPEQIQPTTEDILTDFGHVTKSSRTKRQAIKQIAEKYGLSAQAVYKLLEENK